jgi:hypothetical protein
MLEWNHSFGTLDSAGAIACGNTAAASGDGVGIAIGIEPGPPSIPIPGNGSTESRPTPRWKMHRGRVGVATGALPLKIYG